MKGPLFKRMIKENNLNLDKSETIEDLEKMYTIILESRGKTLSNLVEFDEIVSLAALCQLSFPGKTPSLYNDIKMLRLSFKGIANNLLLEKKFRNAVRLALKNALNEKQIDFGDINNLFFQNE